MGNNYTLKNKVKVSAVTVSGKAVEAGGACRFQPDALNPNTKGVARLSTATTVSETMSPTVAAMQGLGQGAVSGADPAKCDLRFMQFIRINDYRAVYAGRKDSDGMIEYYYKQQLTGNWLLDCLTNATATSAVNLPFYNSEQTAKTAASFFPTINDTPSARVELELYNGEASRRNYLWNFSSDALFVTYLVFVHPDGTREPLEGFSWRLQRDLELRWKGGDPKIHTYTSTLNDFKKQTLKPEHDITKLAVSGNGKVVNVESNAALAQLRSDSRISFSEMKNYWYGFISDFWTD